jgi:hypothetical protein
LVPVNVEQSWNQTERRAAITSSIDVVATVERTCR